MTHNGNIKQEAGKVSTALEGTICSVVMGSREEKGMQREEEKFSGIHQEEI